MGNAAPPVRRDIALIGLWHLGSVSAGGLTSTGRSVVAWDPDPALRETIAEASGPVVEPGLDGALAAARASGHLMLAADPATAIAAAPVTYLAYDTGVDADGRPADPRLDDAVEVFTAYAPAGALLLVSSQLQVGTCGRWRDLLAAQGRGLLLAHAPENLRLGRALEDFMRPERLLVGADDDAAFERAAELLEPFATSPIRLGLAAAEMSKHATNTYLALCVAFANELAWLSLCAGADPNEVADALRADPRVSPSAPLRPGAAFSGATLTRDLVVLRDLGERCGRPELFAAAIQANERHARVVRSWLEEELETVAERRIAIAGLTYKPGTSTLRDSLPLRLADELLARGATVAAWDPVAEEVEPRAGFRRAATLADAVRDADAVAVMTALPELPQVRWKELAPARRLVVDGCMALERRTVEAAGWTYRGLALR